MNKVILIGNLTKTPEMRATQSGKSVTTFTVAVQRKYKNESGGYDSDFISCLSWGKTAEFVAKYFVRGSKIALVGSLQTRNYEDNDGVKRYVTEVIADEVEFVENKKTNDNEDKPATMVAIPPMPDGDDLPF